ncbi:MAG: sulfite oxidase [Actinobacteria bacterium]|nr:sulfite oxidase [Actinomycetota bacterium]
MGSIDEADYFDAREEQLLVKLQREHGLSRRQLLKLGARGALALAAGGSFLRSPVASAFQQPSGIVKKLPEEWFERLGTNAEMKWQAMADEGYLTPVEKFFVRNHTATEIIDPLRWRLGVFGSGLKDPTGRSFSLRDLRRMPSETQVHFMECAGNGRSFFGSQQGTPAPGSQWKLGAVGVAEWRGVPLREVLERAGVKSSAVDVMPQGLDAEVITKGVNEGHVRRPLPLAKALDDALLAYEMNGEMLQPDHGMPLRLIVPGWVGVASIKWLGQIEVADVPLYSPWNTTQYRMIGPEYPPDSPPLTRQRVKSAFELPVPAALPGGKTLRLHGRSWSGNGSIKRVEVYPEAVSTPPSGPVYATAPAAATPVRGAKRPTPQGWHPALLEEPNPRQAWVRWSFDWRPPGPGNYQLRARATDQTGQRQPEAVPFNNNGYLFWATVRHSVTVG